jgi:hypothetical protein
VVFRRSDFEVEGVLRRELAGKLHLLGERNGDKRALLLGLGWA